MDELLKSECETSIEKMIRAIGDDPDREGLKETPSRIVRMWSEIFRGYDKNKRPPITVFDNDTENEMVVADSGTFYSMCEHHILPFFGTYRFVYRPAYNGKILGISKVSRIVSWCAAKLQVQERLACEICDELWDALAKDGILPKGMAIEMEAVHMCKSMRGAKSNGSMRTLYHKGVFDDEMRSELDRMRRG